MVAIVIRAVFGWSVAAMQLKGLGSAVFKRLMQFMAQSKRTGHQRDKQEYRRNSA